MYCASFAGASIGGWKLTAQKAVGLDRADGAKSWLMVAGAGEEDGIGAPPDGVADGPEHGGHGKAEDDEGGDGLDEGETAISDLGFGISDLGCARASTA